MKIRFHRHIYYWRSTGFFIRSNHLRTRNPAICKVCGKKTLNPRWPLWKER